MNKTVIAFFGNLPRSWKRALLILFDIAAVSVALWSSFSLRFGVWSPPSSLNDFVIIATAPIVAIPIFIRFGLYRAVIRYLPERALWTVLQATTLSAVIWVVVAFLSEMAGRGIVPRSVPILYWAISTMLIGASRFLAKRLLWDSSGRQVKGSTILIYGAGEAGANLANALRREGVERIVGFLDDETELHGRDVAGIRVFPPSQLPRLVEQYGIDEVIVSMSEMSGTERQRIVAAVAEQRVKVRTVPAISELMSGRYLISQIREIDIDELLGRSFVPADHLLLERMIRGKAIMVTGAGGSIGSELCRLIVKWAPSRLVLFESNEFALYQIDRELAGIGEQAVVPVLGSVADPVATRRAIRDNHVQVLFHAAAHKHVPLVEANALEGIRNNVFGTKTVLDTAYELGVENFVLISSDKAVRPTNVMGATKRWAELLMREKAEQASRDRSSQKFCAVRFGNVLGSNGSVVPLFKEQITRGGPVTVTDPAMTRYFMSIHEATELIVQAGALSEGGDIFLLDMGEPVLIRELAENMIKLAGFTVKSDARPDGDIEIIITGKRPGEKMFEELFYDSNQSTTTLHPKIMRGLPGAAPGEKLDQALAHLTASLRTEDEAEARKVLFDFIR